MQGGFAPFQGYAGDLDNEIILLLIIGGFVFTGKDAGQVRISIFRMNAEPSGMIKKIYFMVIFPDVNQSLRQTANKRNEMLPKSRRCFYNGKLSRPDQGLQG
jgi:hypothetical protein